LIISLTKCSYCSKHSWLQYIDFCLLVHKPLFRKFDMISDFCHHLETNWAGYWGDNVRTIAGFFKLVKGSYMNTTCFNMLPTSGVFMDVINIKYHWRWLSSGL
jgi:hypothetical protein